MLPGTGVWNRPVFSIIGVLAYGLLSLSLLCNRECIILSNPPCYARNIPILLPPPCHMPPTRLCRTSSVERRCGPPRLKHVHVSLFSVPCCPRRMNVHVHIEVMQNASSIAGTAQRCVEGSCPPISGISRVGCMRAMHLEDGDSEETGSDAEVLAADGNRHGAAGESHDGRARRRNGAVLGSASPGGRC